ncbi:hypothetical protein [Micromonospora chokoriensis]|uniref:hypothetical protein n=1 Tax=Micromonospora chokoriensis TaxID=356851 RepID=UPI00068C217F|nr:hypothetical protein [Micromonospora chokoriensis]
MTLEELTERSTEDVARARAERIRAGIHTYLETLAEIALAWERRDWAVLGYADWQGYVDGEFGADRLRLPIEHRQKAVAELRIAGMSQRAIAAVVGVDQATVKRDLDAADADASPAAIRGADGKTYAATRPTPPATPAAVPAGPPPDEQVWVAIARKGIEAHRIKSSLLTRCSRATRTGLTLPAGQATNRWGVTWCRVCWPAEETTRFAAGEPVPTGPADEAHDPRASRDAGAERRDSAPAGTPTTETAAGVAPADGADVVPEALRPGTPVAPDVDHAAPAPAPPAPTPAAGGAGVTPDPGKPRLTLSEIARLRAVFDWARAGLAGHPRNAAGRGKHATICMQYAPGEPTPPVHPTAAAGRGPVALVEVTWGAGQVDIFWRSDKYELDVVDMWPVDVHQAIDLLCAYGVLPDRFSRQYAAGVQAGMRAGDAIDGEWTETTDA